MAFRPNSAKLLSVSEVASLFGCSEDVVLQMIKQHSEPTRQEFFSIGELARRWRCSRGTVYNRLRSVNAKVLDFAAPGKKCKKAVQAAMVLQIETKKTKILT
jgi:predicted DNA-binding protein YlxM (UPF0122 family)